MLWLLKVKEFQDTKQIYLALCYPFLPRTKVNEVHDPNVDLCFSFLVDCSRTNRHEELY